MDKEYENHWGSRPFYAASLSNACKVSMQQQQTRCAQGLMDQLNPILYLYFLFAVIIIAVVAVVTQGTLVCLFANKKNGASLSFSSSFSDKSNLVAPFFAAF